MRKIKQEIWDLLLSRGYKISPHSNLILKRFVEIEDSKTGRKSEREVKYKFGSNNLQKFIGGVKRYSISYKRLDIIGDKITNKL